MQSHIKAVPGEMRTINQSYIDGVIDGFTVYLPSVYNEEDRSYPMLIFLHGGLGVGGSVDVVNEQPLPQLILNAKDNSLERNPFLRDSFVVVSPHLTAGSFRNRQFYNQEEAIREIIEDVRTACRIDSKRIYMTGLSRGGHGTWGLGARMADELAAIIPICGALHGVDDYAPFDDIAIWTAHNTGDHMVDYRGTESAVQKIESTSPPVFSHISSMHNVSNELFYNPRIFTSFDREGHDAWTEMYESVALYKWLLNQRK